MYARIASAMADNVARWDQPTSFAVYHLILKGADAKLQRLGPRAMA